MIAKTHITRIKPLSLSPFVPRQVPIVSVQDHPIMDDSLTSFTIAMPLLIKSISETKPNEKIIYADLGSICLSDAPMKSLSTEEQMMIYLSLSHTLPLLTTKSGTPPIPPKR